MSKLQNIVGQKSGNWTVIKHSHRAVNKNGAGVHFWICRCKCGTERAVRGDSITRGRTKSCGCILLQEGKQHPAWRGHEDISATVWKQIRYGASSRNYSLDVTIEDIWKLFIQQKGKCALSGVELTFPKNARDTSVSASLDRKDSSKGYTIDNVQWVHKRINSMKNNDSDEQFVKWCQKVVEHSKKKVTRKV